MGLDLTCNTCGSPNEPDVRYCRECRAPLTSSPESDPEVRKTVTVLFSDVTDSTRLGQELDPESLRRLSRRYFEEMRAVVERHGGMVEKFIGDAVMAVFGVPRSTRTTRCARSARPPRCARRSRR